MQHSKRVVPESLCCYFAFIIFDNVQLSQKKTSAAGHRWPCLKPADSGPWEVDYASVKLLQKRLRQLWPLNNTFN